MHINQHKRDKLVVVYISYVFIYLSDDMAAAEGESAVPGEDVHDMIATLKFNFLG